MVRLRFSVEYDVPVDAAFAYLVEPRHRPEWQSSLRRVVVLDEGPPRVGQRWEDHTVTGMVPLMETTALETDHVWAETGRWRAISADLELRFAPRVPGGCRVEVAFGVRGRGLLRPVGWVATAAGLPAVRADLRKAGRLLAEKES